MTAHPRTAIPDDGLTFPFGDRAPAPGEVVTIVDGIGWWRVPMSGPLKHVNGVLLDDGAGVLAVDTGTASPRSTEAWRAILAGPLAGRPVTRVLGTHMHPDHIGLAGWLCRKFDAPLLMTSTEWLMARMLSSDARPEVPEEQLAFWRAAGWDEAQIARGAGAGWANFGKMIARFPVTYTRLRDGEALTIGGHDWRVVTGAGHSPEHACLIDEQRRILIAGDQVLPKISSNVSLHMSQPDEDPLGDWLGSIAKFKTLPGDLLVLPGHGDPFYGLHARLDALDREHRDRLDALERAMTAAPVRGVDAFPLLFKRAIGTDVIGMATGEALAHLRRLEVEGRAKREVRDGVWWFHRA